jgi:hypothetical protein
MGCLEGDEDNRRSWLGTSRGIVTLLDISIAKPNPTPPPQVRKTPCRPRSWASFSPLQLYPHGECMGKLAYFGLT